LACFIFFPISVLVHEGENAGKDLKMKRLLSWIIPAGSMGLLVLLATPAAAQAPAVRAEIPFSFTVADQVLPPGDYVFAKDQSIIRITAVESNRVWMARVTGGGSDRSAASLHQGMLRFDRHGDLYVLSGVWRAGSRSSYAVAPSRLPREYARSHGVRDVVGTR
jgi:hypothetical protein